MDTTLKAGLAQIPVQQLIRMGSANSKALKAEVTRPIIDELAQRTQGAPDDRYAMEPVASKLATVSQRDALGETLPETLTELRRWADAGDAIAHAAVFKVLDQGAAWRQGSVTRSLLDTGRNCWTMGRFYTNASLAASRRFVAEFKESGDGLAHGATAVLQAPSTLTSAYLSREFFGYHAEKADNARPEFICDPAASQRWRSCRFNDHSGRERAFNDARRKEMTSREKRDVRNDLAAVGLRAQWLCSDEPYREAGFGSVTSDFQGTENAAKWAKLRLHKAEDRATVGSIIVNRIANDDGACSPLPDSELAMQAREIRAIVSAMPDPYLKTIVTNAFMGVAADPASNAMKLDELRGSIGKAIIDLDANDVTHDMNRFDWLELQRAAMRPFVTLLATSADAATMVAASLANSASDKTAFDEAALTAFRVARHEISG